MLEVTPSVVTVKILGYDLEEIKFKLQSRIYHPYSPYTFEQATNSRISPTNL